MMMIINQSICQSMNTAICCHLEVETHILLSGTSSYIERSSGGTVMSFSLVFLCGFSVENIYLSKECDFVLSF